MNQLREFQIPDRPDQARIMLRDAQWQILAATDQFDEKQGRELCCNHKFHQRIPNGNGSAAIAAPSSEFNPSKKLECCRVFQSAGRNLDMKSVFSPGTNLAAGDMR